VTKQKLSLFQVATSSSAQLRTRASQIMWREFSNAGIPRVVHYATPGQGAAQRRQRVKEMSTFFLRRFAVTYLCGYMLRP